MAMAIAVAVDRSHQMTVNSIAVHFHSIRFLYNDRGHVRAHFACICNDSKWNIHTLDAIWIQWTFLFRLRVDTLNKYFYEVQIFIRHGIDIPFQCAVCTQNSQLADRPMSATTWFAH